VVADIRLVFNAPERMTAEAHLTAIIYKYDNRISWLADWACKERMLAYLLASLAKCWLESRERWAVKSTA